MFKEEATGVISFNHEKLQKLSFFNENIREEAGKYIVEKNLMDK